MVEPKKHIEKIIPYPVDEEINWYLKLDFNENLIGPSPKVIQALRTFNPDKIKFYPVYNGLLNAISKYNNIPVENILPVNGTDEGYRYIFDAYCSFGDNVLTVTPAFSMPKIYANIANANYIEVPYKDKWIFPVDDFIENIDSSIKLVIVTSPNSPTGDLISDSNLKKIIETAEDSLVIIDETYANYANKTYVDYYKKYKNTVILKSMSKDFATAGLRLGYLVGDVEVINNIKKIVSPYSVNSVAAYLGTVALADTKHLDNVKKETAKSKEYLVEELSVIADNVYPSNANFLCVDFGEKADYIYKKLLRAGIKIKLLSGIAENHFRITIPPLTDAKKLIKVINEKRKLIVFDMDGVLVDASKSYRVAIQKTFNFFSKKDVDLAHIQAVKNSGGYNNDWVLTHKLLTDAKIKVKYEDVVKKFNEFYFGDNCNGLITNEKWLMKKNILEKLHEKYDLAIFTGREKFEADFALKCANVSDLFDMIITSDLLKDDEQKPSGKGIEILKEIIKPEAVFYLGDTRDDMFAGKNANVKTIGVLPPQDKSDELKKILLDDGAITVLSDVNELPDFLEKK